MGCAMNQLRRFAKVVITVAATAVLSSHASAATQQVVLDFDDFDRVTDARIEDGFQISGQNELVYFLGALDLGGDGSTTFNYQISIARVGGGLFSLVSFTHYSYHCGSSPCQFRVSADFNNSVTDDTVEAPYRELITSVPGNSYGFPTT